MRKTLVIFFFLYSGFLQAQVLFRTIVPQQPVVAGESFRVQYVVENAETDGLLIPPPFRGFRFVSGPEQYSNDAMTGGKKSYLKNTVYTLLALKPGRYKIQGAAIRINDVVYRSQDAWVDVILPAQARQQQNGTPADMSSYLLLPGEDPLEKIRQNLFVKVLVDKQSCYPGQPVVATFKLYSRLESSSEIVKNPGFYGFTVFDMLNLRDKVMTTERVNGKLFDVHTIRQVQLYPLQAGEYIIDPMEINNRVRFSRSAISRKPEQKIAEGAGGEEEDNIPGTETFETTVKTTSVTIKVKPRPSSPVPDSYHGGTGRFSINATLLNERLAKNEEGWLVLTIRGKGNFPQLTAPEINWPEGIEGFDPVVNEVLDKAVAPLSGSKTFRYAFVSSKSGNYLLPAIKLSFFDPDSNHYKTVTAQPLKLIILDEEKKTELAETGTKKVSVTAINRKVSFIAAGIVVAAVLLVLLYWMLHKKSIKPAIAEEHALPVVPSTETSLQPAYLEIENNDQKFYAALHQAIWSRLALLFQLSGSEMNKSVLAEKLSVSDGNVRVKILQVLEICEAGMFTQAAIEENREALLAEVKNLLEQVRS